MKAGTFRPDLYYRLHVFCIDLPPLRDRREDIPLLVNHFLNKFCMATSRPVPQIAPEALEVADAPRLAGQRARAGERRRARAGGGPRPRKSGPPISRSSSRRRPSRAGKTLDDVERAHIERVLRETQHNLSRAARILDIDRTTLYNKLRRYGLR